MLRQPIRRLHLYYSQLLRFTYYKTASFNLTKRIDVKKLVLFKFHELRFKMKNKQKFTRRYSVCPGWTTITFSERDHRRPYFSYMYVKKKKKGGIYIMHYAYIIFGASQRFGYNYVNYLKGDNLFWYQNR